MKMTFLRRLFPTFLVTTKSLRNLNDLSSVIDPVIPTFQNFYNNGFGLDVNCKTGESTNMIQKQFPALQFFGVDNSSRAINVARKNFGHHLFLQADVEKEKLQIIPNFQVIQISDYDNCWKILENTYSLLEENGILILHYQSKDVGLMNELYQRNKRFPRRRINSESFENMYLFPQNKTAILFK